MPLSDPAQMHETFGRAMAARDVDALLDLYESGAIQLQQDGSVLQGKDALRGVFEQLVQTDMQAEGTQQSPLINGELALTSTRYRFESAAGAMTHMVTAEVSQRQPDGTWRVVIDAPYFFTD